MHRRGLEKAGIVLLTLALATTAGCVALGGEEASDAVAPQAGVAGETEATRALRAAGFADPYLDVPETGVVREFEFWVDENVVLRPYGDKALWAFGFTDNPDEPATVPGPEIRVTQGDTVRVTLHTPDSAFPGHTMHWHGVDVPWSSDGVPFVTQDMAGTNEAFTYTYEFVARQPGTYWYHCVAAFPVDIDHGMFGALIVEPRDPTTDLPFDREETLIFHEMDSQWLSAQGWVVNPKSNPDPNQLPSNPVDAVDSVKSQARSAVESAGFVTGDATGEYLLSQEPRDYYPEWSPRYKPEYDTFMINGKSYPETDPVEIREGETVRLRLINAGQLPKSIHLHGHHMLVTHVDGYPLPEPHWEDSLSLAAGERKDVYVQGTNPGIWSLHDHAGSSGMGSTSTNEHAFPGGMKTVLVYEGFEPSDAPRKPDGGHAAAGDYSVYAPRYLAR